MGAETTGAAGRMSTLGDLRAATAWMDGDLALCFALDVLGSTVHCTASAARFEPDPCLGFDQAVVAIGVDPDVVAGDDELMAALNERRDLLEEFRSRDTG